MSGSVQAQADVGTLSLQGLGAFTSVLATLSADNVSPVAMIQLENLGAMFPTNGDCAEKVKTLLQRCSDVRLNNLALVIGWRKNDSASLMANSAGGQAISLLSLCLINLFSSGDTGKILQRLCAVVSTNSTKRFDIASVSQLADAARLLSGKLETLGFGNLLAHQTLKIHSVYTALGIAAPGDLLEGNLDVESVVQLLTLTSRALVEDDKICRISGSRGMGYILSLLLTLFPRTTMVTIEGTIIQNAEDAAIKIEIISVPDSKPIKIYLETIISATSPPYLPIDPGISLAIINRGVFPPYRFRWSGWLADSLQTYFLNVGLECDQNILDACCEFLMLIPAATRLNPPTYYRPSLDPASLRESSPSVNMTLLELLGPLPRARMNETCKVIWRGKPRAWVRDIHATFKRLQDTVRIALRGNSCTCPQKPRCDWGKGWPIDLSLNRGYGCTVKCVWEAVGFTLNNGLWAFLINAGKNVVIGPNLGRIKNYCNIGTEKLNSGGISAAELTAATMKLISFRDAATERELAISSDSCTIYPAVIETLSLPDDPSFAYNLVEGQIVYEKHYHQSIRSNPGSERAKATSSLGSGDIRPSQMGIHDGLPLLTIREGYGVLELRCVFQYAGNEVEVDLADVIKGYIGLKWLDECPHNPNARLESCPHHPNARLESKEFRAISTSIAAPSGDGVHGVAMTKGNTTAQFFCCSVEYQSVLQRRCCLNCAATILEKLQTDDLKRKKGVIIAG